MPKPLDHWERASFALILGHAERIGVVLVAPLPPDTTWQLDADRVREYVRGELHDDKLALVSEAVAGDHRAEQALAGAEAALNAAFDTIQDLLPSLEAALKTKDYSQLPPFPDVQRARAMVETRKRELEEALSVRGQARQLLTRRDELASYFA